MCLGIPKECANYRLVKSSTEDNGFLVIERTKKVFGTDSRMLKSPYIDRVVDVI